MGLPLAQPVQEVTVIMPADSEPRDVPPWTVNPVVVAFPKLEFPVTPREPREAPPVTVSEVEVPAPKTKEPSNVPP